MIIGGGENKDHLGFDTVLEYGWEGKKDMDYRMEL